ncbi:NfeD family protein [Sinanaerobacter chloroacetimidivorans]|uniref:NfeD family protein n=1 Tax=Sinanaerobacter chloroacetimidivorans TaxID=2818044 RepID=A0A8J7VYF1_9FIRM|nr:NfeD family protein [Sinanaerobacter chloroacetimidivorans]MBR0596323.1 NfeD family protein [Sinanaerobacter chloroacetimidivorans]
MVDWWNGLDLVLKILYCIAIPATLILVIQTILSLLGGFEGGAGVDFSDTSGIDFNGGSDIGEMADAADMSGTDFLSDGGNPADFSIMSMLTLQGIVTFLTVMGWTSIVAIASGTPGFLSIIVGIVLGFFAMYAAARILHASRKLTENGTLNLSNAIGETGRVYVPIPSSGSGTGKVTLNAQGRYLECDALNYSEEVLPTGTMVRIVDVRNDILVVEEDQ